ncbi:phosphopyruvate hydratase [Candidatus Dependentiae bacterium]|nr:phosphopyruvate hydratase [Candidatus Dependentiae bacterium]
MKIIDVVGREIYDSRGMPTLECTLVLEEGVQVSASVPSGLSRSSYEARELRDGGQRLMGAGVLRAIENLEQIIGPELIGKTPDLVSMDVKMIEMDGTPNKAFLGSNTILAASMAICKAQAYLNDMETYELIGHLCNADTVSLPFPMFNVINGGRHANNNLMIQEFLIVPTGAENFRHSFEIGVTVFQELKKILVKLGKSTSVGDEGGFAPHFDDDRQALDCIMNAIGHLDESLQDSVVIAIDVAASQLYDRATKTYRWRGKSISDQELIGIYSDLLDNYPIYSIEDGMSELDPEGFTALMDRIGDSVQVVGDDLFATNIERIVEGIENNRANAVVIKPNQIGTVSETLQALMWCKENDVNTIVSHRSGETNDTFIVDLAVGASVGQIKAGGCSRGERMAKYNALLRLEDELANALEDDAL